MVFSLASLLRIRRLKEDQAAGELARSRSRASALAAERHQLIDTMSDHGHDNPDVRGIAAIAAARASTSAMLADLDALAAEQRIRVRMAEGAHADAKRETTTIEKLEDRARTAERARELSAEQQAIDEIAARVRMRYVAPIEGDR